MLWRTSHKSQSPFARFQWGTHGFILNHTCQLVHPVAMNKQRLETPASDIELMSRILQRDQGALAELYQRYGAHVYGLALRVLQKRELAEEITQDTFLNVWRQPEAWNPALGRLSSWLLTVARYKAIDRVRREQRRPDTQADPLDDDHLRPDASLAPDATAMEDGRLIRSLVAQLPVEQAQIIELAFFQGMTHSAVAELLDLPLGTVKTRVRLGLQKLRTLWEASTDPDG
jgi:RNA polymerase sigma-70 factor (ECF subfamily)